MGQGREHSMHTCSVVDLTLSHLALSVRPNVPSIGPMRLHAASPDEFQAPRKVFALVAQTSVSAIPPANNVSRIQTGENEREETLRFVTRHPASQAPLNLGVETQTPRACR